jgi:hypothetical protein
MEEKKYPDLADIFAERAKVRSDREKLPIDEKLKAMDKPEFIRCGRRALPA